MYKSVATAAVGLMALTAPVQAEAIEFGMGTSYEFAKLEFAAANTYQSRAVLPTLDFYIGPVILQWHVLDFLSDLGRADAMLGFDVYFTVVEAELVGPLKAVVQPGVSLDFDFSNEFIMGLGGTARFGVEVGDKLAAGLYFNPLLGFVIDTNNAPEFDFLAGGALEISAWYTF